MIWLLLLACSSEAPSATDTRAQSDSGAVDTGTLDTGDRDGDGIPSQQERAEGTDPGDPRSASAWHPEWTERPRLLLGPDDLPRLRERWASDEQPWATLRGRIEAGCTRAQPEVDDQLTYAQTLGNIALDCAVASAAGETALGEVDPADRAAAMIEALPVENEDPHDTAYNSDLYMGYGLLQGARAWDLLVATGYPDGRDPQVAADRLHALAAWVWDFYVVDWPVYMATAQNNHDTKLASAFGAVGMGVPDDPRAARYVSLAATELPRLDDELFADDGTYAEGPHYRVYASESTLPWLGALDRYLGDGSLSAWSVCDWSTDPDCAEGAAQVASPLRTDPRFCASFDRFTELLMPTGVAPNIDDANLSQGPLGLASGLCQDGVAAWGWDFQASDYVSSGSADVSADTLVWFDPEVAAVAPEVGPLAPATGGLLRTGLGTDDAYALLLAEAGIARTGGGGHEHPDALAFLWEVGADYLLIDCGYGNWDVHENVAQGAAHNVVQIDDVDSAGVDATLLGVEDLGAGVQVARAEVELGGVRWQRVLVLGGKGALLVFDHLRPSDGAAHDYNLTLHGASDDLTEDGASWPSLGLNVATACSAETTVTTGEAEHGFSWDLALHGVRWERTRGGDVDWLTVAVAGEAATVEGETMRWSGGEASLDGAFTVGDVEGAAW